MSAPPPGRSQNAEHAIIRKTIWSIAFTIDSRSLSRSAALAEHNQLTMRSSLAWCDRKKPCSSPRPAGHVPSSRCLRGANRLKRGARCKITSGAMRSAREPFDGQSRNHWWSQTGSNRRPHACKARALPTELWPPGHAQGAMLS